MINPEEIRNAMNEPLDVGADLRGCYLFFIDQYPEANWAHECAYAFIETNSSSCWVDAEWPPEEGIQLNGVTSL